MDSLRTPRTARLSRTTRLALVAPLLALVTFVGLSATSERGARAEEHAFGLGIELGAPTGLALKYYLGKSSGRGGMVALQAGLGEIESWGPNGLYIHVDVVWHPAMLATTPDFTLPFYVGVGGRLLHWRNDYCYVSNGVEYCGGSGASDFGVRVPFGILMDFRRVPIDVFFELSLVFDLLHSHPDNSVYYDHYNDNFLSLDGVLGARYYF